MIDHEQVLVQRGARSELPIIIAVHSTRRGQAVGGCRLQPYADWRLGLEDALRLSEAMTLKTAVNDLPHGGGKTVVVAPAEGQLSDTRRRDVLADVADAIERLRGAYATGPDVGTSPADMSIIGATTRHVFCRPEEEGGSGDSSYHTAVGVLAAIRAALPFALGTDELAGRRVAIVGLGRVGGWVARLVRDAGAECVVSDVDARRRSLASELGARWVEPARAMEQEVDLLVPAALGGVLTPTTVPRLRCAAVVGPANNQLDEPRTADLLQQRGITWVPDFVASAGGVVHATAVELRDQSRESATREVEAIGATVRTILEQARQEATTPLAAARALARLRLATAA